MANEHGVRPGRGSDLIATMPYNAGSLNFYHPDMQHAMIDAAAEAGAEVL